MSKSRSLNKVMLIGNLTRDPIVRIAQNGVKVCSFGIATNTSWKNKDGNIQERTEFHNLIAFNKLAEICAQVLAVGMQVYIEGELRTKVSTDQNGKKYYRTEIKINDMILIDAKGKKGVGLEQALQSGDRNLAQNNDIDDSLLSEASSESESQSDYDKLF